MVYFGEGGESVEAADLSSSSCSVVKEMSFINETSTETTLHASRAYLV
jgi:hypothetical protein